MKRGRHRHRLLIALVLALLFWTQIAAYAHGLEHLHPTPEEPVCELCVALANLGAGLTAQAPAWTPVTAGVPEVHDVPAAFIAAFAPVYRSRAPPFRG